MARGTAPSGALQKRQYDQFCPVAGALDIVGERWALLIVRELLLGPKRFVDLEAGLPGAGTNTLTTRLDDLEHAGVIARRKLPPPAPSTVYELTEWGRGLEPIVYSIARWAAPKLGAAKPRFALRATWLGVAFNAFFQRAAVRGLTAVVELVLPSGTLTLDFRRGALRVTEGPAATPPALRITGGEDDILELFGYPAEAPAGRRHRSPRIEGDATLIPRLVAAFPLAPPAAAGA